MDTTLSREKAAKCFKVSLPTFNKFVKKHPYIIMDKEIIIEKLNECIEKESAGKNADKEK